MPKYALTKKNEAYLTLEINGTNYNIPLLTKLKVKEVKKLFKMTKLPQEEQFIAMSDFLATYMGEEIVDEMMTEDINEIYSIWMKANDATSEMSLGES